MFLMLFVPFRARFMVARDHQIPFRGARPDCVGPAFALMAIAMIRDYRPL